MPSPDQRGKLRKHLVNATREHHLQERRRRIAGRAEYGDAKPLVGAPGGGDIGQGRQRPWILQLSQRESQLELDTRLGVGFQCQQRRRQPRQKAFR